MSRTAFVLCLLLGCNMAWSQEARFESFERGVPAHFTAARAGRLSVSPWHSKHGKSALRWE